MYAEVKSLPDCIRDALKSIRYGRRDIKVEAARAVSPLVAGGAGQRGFNIFVNLETGEREMKLGSWGGANIFNPNNAVDLDSTPYRLARHVAVIQGETGAHTYAWLYAHPDSLIKMLPGPAEETTLEEQQALYCFAAIRGGQYRREELARKRVTPETIDRLVERGFLKRAKNGNTSITTAGRNARDRRVRY